MNDRNERENIREEIEGREAVSSPSLSFFSLLQFVRQVTARNPAKSGRGRASNFEKSDRGIRWINLGSPGSFSTTSSFSSTVCTKATAVGRIVSGGLFSRKAHHGPSWALNRCAKRTVWLDVPVSEDLPRRRQRTRECQRFLAYSDGKRYDKNYAKYLE